MATIKSEIDALRESIRQTTDDSKWSDEYLYKIWNSYRNKILSQQVDTFRKVNDFNRERFCFELEEAYSHDCGCIELGCTVLVSKYAIPEPIDKLQILTLSGVQIGKSTESEFRSLQYDEVLSSKPRYGIYSGKVFIYNPGSLGVISPAVLQANAVWADPTEWIGIQYCSDTEDGDGDSSDGVFPCKKATDIDAGMSPKYSEIVRRMTLEELGLSLQLPVDKKKNYDDTQTVP